MNKEDEKIKEIPDGNSTEPETYSKNGHITPDPITEIQKKINELQNDLVETKKSLDKDKISIITVLGIFVSIFTFISVEIQVLRYICDFYKIVGFSFILPAILMIFITSLDYVARGWIDEEKESSSILNKRMATVLFISAIFILIGILCINNSKQDWTCKTESSNIININK